MQISRAFIPPCIPDRRQMPRDPGLPLSDQHPHSRAGTLDAHFYPAGANRVPDCIAHASARFSTEKSICYAAHVRPRRARARPRRSGRAPIRRSGRC